VHGAGLGEAATGRGGVIEQIEKAGLFRVIGLGGVARYRADAALGSLMSSL
jgi:hypothetical protein